MNAGNSTAPPAIDEVEVSLFGPGFGESIVIHLGFNEWLIVDSCIEGNLKTPAPLNYLRRIGVDPSQAVKLIVATHWHDDHVGGLAEVFKRCISAKFVCSGALNSDEFFTLADALGARSLMNSSGVDEFYKIMQLLQERHQGRIASITPEWAVADRLLLQRTADALPYQIHSLSPSSGSIALAHAEIAPLVPTGTRQPSQRKKRLVSLRPNHTAVVLWVRVGDLQVLLGSDLEETGDARTGWTVIVDSTTRPSGRATVIKVPHHGSRNGDQPRVWAEMLDDSPVAVLTPFSSGGVSLPTKADADRICRRTDNAYASAVVRQRSVRRPRAVDRTIKEVTRSIRVISGESGQVRLRSNASGQGGWTIDLFGNALPLAKLASAM